MTVEYSFGSIASNSKMLIFDCVETVGDSWFLNFAPAMSLCRDLTWLHHLSLSFAGLLLVLLIYDVEIFIHHYERMLRWIEVHLREVFLSRYDYLLAIQRLKGILRKFGDWRHAISYCSFCVIILSAIQSPICSIQTWIALKMVAWFTKIKSNYRKVLFVSIIFRAKALLCHIFSVSSWKSIIIIIDIHILLMLNFLFFFTLWRIWFSALHEKSILFKLIKVRLNFAQILVCSTFGGINALLIIHVSAITW